ncbi:MAG: hypothetical protein AABX69_05125 [Nanoarchaeota archaeon]
MICASVIQMVEEIKKGSKVYYTCEECGFAYETKGMAQKCQGWCREHHSCSLEITKHAVQI